MLVKDLFFGLKTDLHFVCVCISTSALFLVSIHLDRKNLPPPEGECEKTTVCSTSDYSTFTSSRNGGESRCQTDSWSILYGVFRTPSFMAILQWSMYGCLCLIKGKHGA